MIPKPNLWGRYCHPHFIVTLRFNAEVQSKIFRVPKSVLFPLDGCLSNSNVHEIAGAGSVLLKCGMPQSVDHTLSHKTLHDTFFFFLRAVK